MSKLAAEYLDVPEVPEADIPPDSQVKSLAQRMNERLFNIHAKPVRPTPAYYINGIPICTAGNLTAISGPPKEGKSAVIGAMMSATMPQDLKADTLGITSTNPQKLAVIHFDTEQSRYDHHALVERELRRAGLTPPPAWLRSYCLTGFSAREARLCIKLAMEQAKEAFGGIHSVLIDGSGDCALDVNDPAEANEIVAEWHALAIEHGCPIIGNIHLNPGTKKTRGHLGSQLERKAETNLCVAKDAKGRVTLWGDKNRHAPILKHDGPCFAWSDSAGMHVTVQTMGEIRESESRTRLLADAKAVFELTCKPALRWSEFLAPLMKVCGFKTDSGARKRLEKMIGAQVLLREVTGLYTLAQ
jgi:hypothetical protein